MKQVLKENLVLVAGIVLPLILCVVFFVAQKVSTMGIDPPQYAIVISDRSFHRNNEQWSYEVKEGRLSLSYTPPEKGDYWNPPVFYIFDPKTKNLKTIKVPVGMNRELSANIVLEEFKDVKLSTDTKSPDGFEFMGGGYTGGAGIMTALFDGGNRQTFVLKKEGLRVKIPIDKYLYDATFIGWVMP